MGVFVVCSDGSSQHSRLKTAAWVQFADQSVCVCHCCVFFLHSWEPSGRNIFFKRGYKNLWLECFEFVLCGFSFSFALLEKYGSLVGNTLI